LEEQEKKRERSAAFIYTRWQRDTNPEPAWPTKLLNLRRRVKEKLGRERQVKRNIQIWMKL
jgi:hypothetical protein